MTLKKYLKKHKKTHLIFDFDETLFKLDLPWEKWEEGIKNKLVELDPEIYSRRKTNKISLSEMQNEYVIKFGDKIKKIIINNTSSFEKKYLNKIIVNNELLDFIKSVKGYKFFIFSSNSNATIVKVLSKYEIKSKFEKIISRNEVSFIKPQDEGFNFLYDPEVDRKNYLIIGDSKFDKEMAKKAGVDFFQIKYF